MGENSIKGFGTMLIMASCARWAMLIYMNLKKFNYRFWFWKCIAIVLDKDNFAKKFFL